MAWDGYGLRLEKVGIIGSGQIGPDIALHFTKVLAPHGVPIVVVDILPEALERGAAKLKRKVERGVSSGAFSPEQAAAMIANVTFTEHYGALDGTGLILEAATEDLGLKQRIFQQVSASCAPDTILASNSSHLEPERIFEGIEHPERSLVLHYFFPAERNLLVEIVSGPETDPGLAARLETFYEQIGKVPVRVQSRYGYAVDPIFEGLFLASALCVESGMGTTKEVDAAARRALGLGVGPFTAMNLTGGNPITDHGLDELHERVGPWFRSPALLKEQMVSGEPWEVPAQGEQVELEPERESAIADAMRGAFFGLAAETIESGIITPDDLELAVRIGLVMEPPLLSMNRTGVPQSLRLVEAFAEAHPGFPVPDGLVRQARSGELWAVSPLQRRDQEDIAVVVIRRPEVLNALNAEVYDQLKATFKEIGDDPSLRGAVLTGFGTKAFVSGADVGFLASISSPEEGFATCESSKAVGEVIEGLGKPVVCAMNGLTFGGGLELALCCTGRVCRAGEKVLAGQPEVNLGFIPGAGATQRLPRLVGLEAAARMLRTGRPISGSEAVAIGLVDAEVSGDLLAEAVRRARGAADAGIGSGMVSPEPMDVPETLPETELGHLSRAIDALLCRALLEGCRMPLAEGLRLESELFAECCRTEDMGIGVKNFLEKGPRAQAAFVHR